MSHTESESKVLKVAFPSKELISKYEPTNINLDYEYIFLENVFSPLVEVNKNGDIEPGVAEKFEWVGDELKLSIRSSLKTAKAKDRMQQKLNFYTESTRVDGVIYFYSKNRIDHNLHELFIDQVLEKSLRVKHYGKNFLLTSELHDDVEKSMKLLKNRNNNYFSFQNWLDQLATSSASNRRVAYFDKVCNIVRT